MRKPLTTGTKRKTGPETLSRAERQRYEELFAHLRGMLWDDLDYVESGFTARLEAFAKESGLSVGTIRKLMDGAYRENPQFLTIFKLSIQLGCVDELIRVFRKTNSPITRVEAKRTRVAKKRKTRTR